MSNIKQIVKNTLAGWGAKAIQIPIVFLIVPFLVKIIGTEGYGLIGLFSVFTALAAVADLGLRGALGRELASSVALGDQQKFREISATAFLLFLVIGSILVALIWFLSPWLVHLFKVGENLRKDAVTLFRIYGCATIAISFIVPVFSSGLASFMRFDLNNMIQAILLIMTNFMVFVLVSIWKDNALHVWVWVQLLGAVGSLVAYVFAYRTVCFQGVLNLKLARLKHLRSLFSLGSKMYIIQLAQALSDKADPLIISSFLGPASVALYQTAAKVSLALNPVVMVFTGQLYPLTTKYHATGNHEKMECVLCEGTKYTLLLGVLIASGMFVFAEPFSYLWLHDALGNDYKVVSQVMMIFAITELFTYSSGTIWPILLGMKKLTFLTNLLIITAVLNIALSIYLVGYTSVGLFGVLWGTLISKIIRTTILLGYIIKLIKIPALTFISRVFIRPAICLVVTGAAGFVLKSKLDGQTWEGFVFAVALTVTAWSLSCLLFGLSQSEISALWKSVCKLKSKIYG